MSSMAFHQETLRKARVQERAKEAQRKLLQQQQTTGGNSSYRREPREPYQPVEYSSDPRRTHSYESGDRDYRMAQLQRGASAHPGQHTDSHSSSEDYVYKDLKRQEKTLRNHNMVMGPVEAFQELLEPANYKNYQPHGQY